MAGTYNVVFGGGPPPVGSTLIAVIGLGNAVATGSVNTVVQAGVLNWELVGSAGLISDNVRLEIWAAQNVPIGISDTVTITPTNLVDTESSAVVLAAANLRSVGTYVDQSVNDTGLGSPADTGASPITTSAKELWVGGFAMRPPTVPSGPTNGFGITGNIDSGVGDPNITTSLLSKVVNFVAAAQTALSGAPAPTDWAAALVTFLGEVGQVLICNRSPEPNSVGSVDSGTRFSLRTLGTVVLRSEVYFHLGSGPSFYPGGFLPEDHEVLHFVLQTKFFSYHDPVIRSIDGSTSELIIDKAIPNQIQAGSYFFGGLESPATPEAPIMLEFTLKMADGDVGNIESSNLDDQYQLTGVESGFMINDTGCVVRFMSDGIGARWVELHDPRSSGFGSPIAPLILHDWDQNQAWTYKVLWQPRLNICRLYVSTGQANLDSDLLIVDAQVTDFVTVPPGESRENQPVAFFGHGHGTPISISRWANAYLYNIVSTPVVMGVFPGRHTGLLQSDDVVRLDATELPRHALQPWNYIPDVFDPGNIDGNEVVSGASLTITRAGVGKTFGYFRCEPTVAVSPIVFDFQLAAFFNKIDESTVNTGMEVFIDDGVRVARIVFLLSANTQLVGILTNGANPQLITSYNATIYGWGADTSYRIVFQPGAFVRLSQLSKAGGELEELLITSATYTALPITRDPGNLWTPALGIMVNGVEGGDFLSSMRISRLRYSANLRLLEGTTTPGLPWVENPGGGDVTSDGSEIHINDSDDTDRLVYIQNEPSLSAIVGCTIEFKVRVDAYEVHNPQSLLGGYSWDGSNTVLTPDTLEVSVGDYVRQDLDGRWFLVNTVNDNVSVVLDGASWPAGGLLASSRSPGAETNPVREIVGVGVSIDDGSFQTKLVFADEGPNLGKIMFLATQDDLQANLLAIRSLDPSTAGTYASVDWTKSLVYRIERTDGVGIRVYVDDSDTPLITFDLGEFNFPPSEAAISRVVFGSFMADRKTSSYWKFVRYSISAGIDVAAFPILSDNEALGRFNHAINVIVEAQDVP